jgi:hypothetical protein
VNPKYMEGYTIIMKNKVSTSSMGQSRQAAQNVQVPQDSPWDRHSGVRHSTVKGPAREVRSDEPSDAGQISVIG